jgi:hypothetical protein
LAPPEAVGGPNDPIFRSPYLVINESNRSEGQHPIAIGDLNGDQAADLVVIRSGYSGPYGNVGIYFGDGYGNFLKPVNLDGALTRSTWGVNLADLNGDNRLDLLFTSNADTLLNIRLGRGDGTFDPVFTVAPRVTANTVAVGDMNEDGLVDLVIGQSFGSGYSIMSGDGSGHFVFSHRGNPIKMAEMILTDMNGDRHLDIVGTGINYAVGDGLGGVVEERWAGWSTSGNSVAVVDLDGDGNKDLITANSGDGYLYIRYSSAGGVFEGSRDYRFAVEGGIRSIVARDLDSDGRPEIVIGASGIRIYAIDAGGHLQLRKVLDSPTANPAIETADLNADGLPDIVAGSSGAIGVYLTGPGLTDPSLPATPLAGRPGPVVSGDFSGDGYADVAVLRTSQEVVDVLRGGPEGSLVEGPHLTVGQGPRAMQVADLDLDGLDDIVVADSLEGKITVLRQLADHTWERQDHPAVAGMHWLAIADVDQDGRPDVVTQERVTSDIAVMRGSAAGLEFPVSVASPGWPTEAGRVADFDGDGDPDLMLVRWDGTAAFLGGAAGIAFAPKATFYGSTSYRVINDAAICRFDQDSAPDAILCGKDGYSIVHNSGPWAFNGGGWTGTGNWDSSEHGMNRISVANLEADGATDLVATLGGRPFASVYRLTPGVGFEENVWSYGFGPTVPEYQVLADITGDGLLDLVVTDPDSQRLVVAPHVSASSTAVIDSGTTASASGVVYLGSLPNPVRRQTAMLRFDRMVPGRLRIEVLDVRGRIVRHLFDDSVVDVVGSFAWDVRNDDGTFVSPGIYFARATLARGGEGRRSVTGKIVVLP